MPSPTQTVFPNRSEIEDLAANRPDLWAKCYPKIYEGLDGGTYASAKIIAYFLLTIAVKLEQPEVKLYQHFNETVEAIWASRLASNRVPVFWLTRELVEALKLTTLPVTLDFTKMKLPFEAAVFMLPKGSLTYQNEATDVAFVSYARAALKEVVPSINASVASTLSGRGDFTTFAGMMSGRLLNWSHPWEIPLDVATLDATVLETPDNTPQTAFQHQADEYDKHFMARVAHLVFNTLQLMLSRPDVVAMGSLVKEVHDRNRSVKSFWKPNMVGTDYRLRRETNPLGGTHASPRGHWVRGFWRNQACGPNLSERKEVWIEPFWRGGE